MNKKQSFSRFVVILLYLLHHVKGLDVVVSVDYDAASAFSSKVMMKMIFRKIKSKQQATRVKAFLWKLLMATF